MRQKKKGSFFTFIFSFLPGAAEMYMGFMKNGLSLMAVFFLTAMITANGYADVFMFFTAVVWFYGFFHARNLAGLDDVTFMALEDRFIWEEFSDGNNIKLPEGKLYKLAAVFLILFGVGILWGYAEDVVYALIPENYWNELYPVVNTVMRAVPQIVLAVILIAIGIVMIKGKKKELEKDTKDTVREVEDGKDDKNA